jgi:signal transduction histidine kinase
MKKKIEIQENAQNYLCAITHELKNSLCISKGYLDMIKKDKTKLSYLKIVRKEINRSIEMIQDGLNISKDKLNYEILDINVLLEDISETLEGIFKKNKIKYKINYIDDEVYILGDYEKLKQVFINIIKNSIESKEKNLKIEINNYIVKNEICITIKDNGIGIDDLSKIGKNYSNKYQGMGIGTTFSQNIISKHKGKLIYESTKNEGTEVNVLLPLFK